jgi:hypothetical protein
MTPSPENVVRLKVAAALAAFAAGVVAVVMVVLLAHSTPSAGSTSSGPQAASAPPTPPAASSTFPAPPAGALVLAKEDRDLAVALALSPDDSLQTSVVGQEGPASGLSVTVNSVRAKACGAGCYRVGPGVANASVEVAIRGPNRPPSTVSFDLPLSGPGPSPVAIVRRAERTWRALETLVVHDHLSSGPGTGIDTVWRFKAPHEMTYRIRNGPAAVAIGQRRWDKLPGHGWQASEQDPITEPIPLWQSVSNAHLLGSPTVYGRKAWKVSFFDSQLPAWFTIWVDQASGRTLELLMTAQAHFMHQVYGPFNSPLKIAPPA